MAAKTGTYTLISSTTLNTATATVTFSSIPATYTDLVLVFRGNNTSSGNRAGYIRFNGDSGNNYSYTAIQGDGASANFSSTWNVAQGVFSNVLNDNTLAIINIQDYSNTTTNKSFISRGNSASTVVQAIVGLWNSTAAINSIVFSLNADSYASGSTFRLYGIEAAK